MTGNLLFIEMKFVGASLAHLPQPYKPLDILTVLHHLVRGFYRLPKLAVLRFAWIERLY
jgi:hypothetical protein